MRPALRRAVLLAALATSTPAVARAQTVCDQLLPIGLQPPVTGFQSGCATSYVLRQGSGPLLFAPLVYPPCANGPCAGLTHPLLFVCAAANGYACCVSVADSILVGAGNLSGPLASGLGQRMANDTDPRTNICYSEYAGNGSRVAEVPLILSWGAGTTRVRVTGFQRMFLLASPISGTILAEFIDGPTPTRSSSWGRTKVRYR
jgi:hypothetical protein